MLDAHTARKQESTAAYPTVAELLDIPELRLHLVVPPGGDCGALSRRVRWVHSTELVEPSQYLRGGELVCTVGTALLDDAACQRFVGALVAVDAAGMCFGLGDVHQQTPDALVRACTEHSLPLLEVPHGVRFLALSEHLAQRRMSAESELSARGERLIAGLLADIRADATLEELVVAVASSLGGRLEVIVGDTAIVHGPHLADDADHQHVVAKTGEAVRIEWHGTSEPPTAELLSQIGRVVDVAVHEQETERLRQRERIGQLLSLVADGLADAAALLPYLEHTGLAGTEVVVSAWPASTTVLLAQAFPAALLGEAPDVAFVLTSDDSDVQRVARELTLACGYGSAVTLSSLARGIAEARACLELARRRGHTVSPQELTSLEGLLEQQPPGRLDSFAEQLLRPLCDYDQDRKAGLVATLRSFVHHEGSLQATADELYLHVNTVRHRLGRIHHLTGRDPTQFDDQVALVIALWAHDRRAGRTGRR